MAASLKQNTDLKNLHKLSMPAKIGLCIVLSLFIVFISYFALFREQLNTLDTLKQKETNLKQVFTTKSIQSASMESLKLELDAIRSSFDVLLKQLPTDAEIPNLIQELHQAAAANGMRMDSVTPIQPSNDGPIQTLPYAIAISGNYKQISQFTRDVGTLSRIITLDTFSLKNDDKNKLLNFTATANTYKVRPAAEIEAERIELEASASQEQ